MLMLSYHNRLDTSSIIMALVEKEPRTSHGLIKVRAGGFLTARLMLKKITKKYMSHPHYITQTHLMILV